MEQVLPVTTFGATILALLLILAALHPTLNKSAAFNGFCAVIAFVAAVTWSLRWIEGGAGVHVFATIGWIVAGTLKLVHTAGILIFSPR